MSGTRHQDGYVFRSGRYWYVRYYETVINKTGGRERVQRCKQLAIAEGINRSKKAAQALAEAFLSPLNDGTHKPESTMSLNQFVEELYLPFVQRQKRPSTYNGYRKMWDRYLKTRADRAIREFRTFECEQMLVDIAAKYEVSTTTLRHVKNFLSGIFRYASRSGVLNTANPLRDVCVPKGGPSRETHAYPLEEITRMLLVLPDDVVPLVATAAFTGVRRGELRGLLWEHYDGSQIRITQSFWNRHLSAPKTVRSAAPVPVIPALSRVLDQHRQACGNPASGLMFRGQHGRPRCLDCVVREIIKPKLKEAGLEWHGWHAFRRGLATNLYRLGIPDKTIQAILRHSNLSTTMNLYVKSVGADAVTAMNVLEGVIANNATLMQRFQKRVAVQ
jgi:integrase